MTLALIIGYIALLFITSRYSNKSGKKHNPWYVVAISMISTSISGVTFVSVPGMVGASGFAYLQMVLGFVAGYICIAYVLLPLYYKLGLTSLYQYLRDRFGPCSYKTGASFFLLSKVLGAGVRMYLSAIVLQLVVFDPLGIPFWTNVLLTVGVVWLYTLRGLRALVWTDMVQTFSLLAVVGCSIVFIGRALDLNAAGLLTSIRESPLSRVFFFDNPSDTRYFFKQFLAGMCTTLAMTGLDQDMMQKNLSCKHLKDGQKNVLSYGISFLPVNLLFLCLGVLLYQYAAHFGITVEKPDHLFPAISCQMGAGRLLFVLGLVAASLSSSGSALNALTTSFTLDILGQKQDGGKVRQKVHAAFALVLGLAIMGFKVIGNQSVINAVYTIASYTYGPLLGLYFFGIFSKTRLKDTLVPGVCILSPLLCLGLTWACKALWNYTIGFELLLLNAALTALGLLCIKKKQ